MPADVERITEADEPRITEAGQQRVLEQEGAMIQEVVDRFAAVLGPGEAMSVERSEGVLVSAGGVLVDVVVAVTCRLQPPGEEEPEPEGPTFDSSEVTLDDTTETMDSE